MKKQGYNDKLDESLGMRHKGSHSQSKKDRRDESKGMEKAMGRRAYQSVGSMDKMAEGGEAPYRYIGNPSVFTNGNLVTPSNLKVGERYEWTGGASNLFVEYIGTKKDNPSVKVGTSLGNNDYLFKWIGEKDGRVGLSGRAVRNGAIVEHADINSLIKEVALEDLKDFEKALRSAKRRLSKEKDNVTFQEQVVFLKGEVAKRKSQYDSIDVSRKSMAKGGGVDKYVLPKNLKKKLDKVNQHLNKFGGRSLTEKEAIRFNIDNNAQSGFEAGSIAFDISEAPDEYNGLSWHRASKRYYHLIGDSLIEISEQMTNVPYDSYDSEIIKQVKGTKYEEYAEGGEIVEDSDGNKYEIDEDNYSSFKDGELGYNPMSDVVMVVSEEDDDMPYINETWMKVKKTSTYADSEFGKLEREWNETGIKPKGYNKAKADWESKGGSTYAEGGEVSDDEYADYLNEAMSYLNYEDEEYIIGGKNRADEYFGRYGDALREYDPIAFEVGRADYERERNYAKGGGVDMPLYRLSVVDDSGRESYDNSSMSKSDAEKIFNEYKSDGIEVALEKRVGKKGNYEYETIKSFDPEDDDFAKGGTLDDGSSSGVWFTYAEGGEIREMYGDFYGEEPDEDMSVDRMRIALIEDYDSQLGELEASIDAESDENFREEYRKEIKEINKILNKLNSTTYAKGGIINDGWGINLKWW